MTYHVAFQGEPGAYSEAALLEYFGDQGQPVPCPSFETVFNQVDQKNCDFGFIPIENSVAGSIHQNYDLLLRYPLVVTGEQYLRISHCLISRPGVELSEIRRVVSHPQALAQCSAYLRALPEVKVEQGYDTAGSVQMISQSADRTTAAIASRRAADLYGMSILAEHIEDNPANFTRFLVISPQVQPLEDPVKTSLVFALKNEPGALVRALSVFSLRGIDLTKIESRPLVGKPWEYLFYIDLIGSPETASVRNALTNLEEFSTFQRVLGSYQRKNQDQ